MIVVAILVLRKVYLWQYDVTMNLNLSQIWHQTTFFTIVVSTLR